MQARSPLGALLLSRSDVERLLTPDACIAAVEDAFRQHTLGNLPAPGILGLHGAEGSFHVKAAFINADRPYFAAKLNANFPHNGARHGLPTIQGVVILCDATSGVPLAVMDSMAITALRTAAATAVAAKYLAPERCEAALICGCGAQAAAQLRALLQVRRPTRVYAYDQDSEKARQFASAQEAVFPIEVSAVSELREAALASRIIVTCTSARRWFLARDMVRPGTFVAAVGADSEHKQEIDPELLAAATLVTDLTEQACTIGDLHHAIAAGVMSRDAVHAELGEVIVGKKHGRTRDDQLIVFDSTGTGLQDVAAAAAVYRRALEQHTGIPFSFCD
jgi:ornithine cyclodeaminase/alanine dehydrogenase-like protein (mu-crystallin family)